MSADVSLTDLPLEDLRWRQKCVLFAVARYGPITVDRLSIKLGESNPTISSSLRQLADMGLVRARPDVRVDSPRQVWERAPESPD